MKIAVLIPCYNVEKYLVACLDSVRAAATPGLEIFCCDDGSGDQTPALLKDYAAQHPEVHAVSQPNAGVSAARNRLLDELPSGFDAFAFVDADDTVTPEIYERLSDAMTRTGADIAECLWEGPETTLEDLSIYRLRRTAIGNWVPIFTKLYRRSILGSVRFRRELGHEEDYLYGYEIHVKARKKVLVPGCYYLHRNNPDSVCNRLNLQKYVQSACQRVRISYEEVLTSDWLAPGQRKDFCRELFKDAVRMCIVKNLKKNRNAATRRELFFSAAACLPDLKPFGFPLNPLRLLWTACRAHRYGLARILAYLV